MLTEMLLIAALLLLLVALANVALWPKVRRTQERHANEISILIPARDEEANLPACLESALTQASPVREILVYNDHSTDGTARVIERFAQRDARVRALDPIPLAAGWCGKNFACWQLAQAAKGNWLLFLDADARLTKGAAVRMDAEMAARQLTMLSCWPRLEMIGFWERALMPMLNFTVFAMFPGPLSLHFNYPSLALAHGACLMFERETYFRLGGHSAVCDQIFEDTRLAQLWRRNCAYALCLDGQDVVYVRMYVSFGEIWRGFQKNFFPAFQREISFWVFLFLHAMVLFAPFPWFAGTRDPLIAVAVVSVLLTRGVLAVYFRHPLWAVFLHPLGEAVLIVIGLSSWWRCKSGRGVAWKGREYKKRRA